MSDPYAQEREELVNQLDELLGEGAVDISDAFEIATCAGLATRLGADPTRLEAVQVWRDGPGQPLLDELWQEATPDDLVEAIEALIGADVDEREVEDTFFDFDDFVAAAVWSGKRSLVAKAAAQVASTVRMAPECFEAVGPYGPQMARLRAVGEDMDLYDYWLAVADVEHGRAEDEPDN